jgi:hypothetical protein
MEGTMKRTYSKLAAQPEHGRPGPKPSQSALTTADRVRLSLLRAPGPVAPRRDPSHRP